MRKRLEKLRAEGMQTAASADSVDAALQNSGFVTEIKDVVVTYIRSAVAGIDLPEISGWASSKQVIVARLACPFRLIMQTAACVGRRTGEHMRSKG
jgi:hypothetical protein|eukprot:COSAG02_NODE_8617_length_2503_cov_6.137271_5_plen_96_part_00